MTFENKSVGGFSKNRLSRLSQAMQGYVERGEIPGVVTCLFRRGELAHQDKIGWFEYENKEISMQDNTLFRIASMTKPILAVAVLSLVEETKLRLDEPVDKWLPELANRQVLVDPDGAIDGETYPSPGPITLRDLLTYRAGIGWMAVPVPYDAVAMSLRSAALLPDAYMKKVSEMPLRYEPGSRWVYHIPSEIMGVLVARVSGMGLEDFFRQRIFEPLGMSDTGFSIPAAQRHRLPTTYVTLPGGEKAVADMPDFAKSPIFPSGGGGLVSTASDYLKFARMLLNNGKLEGVRILSRKTVEVMTTDYLTPEQHTHNFLLPNFWQDVGFGFGVSVVTRATRIGQSVGAYGWGGAFGTYWINDPSEDLVALLMIQQGGNTTITDDFRTLVYQAIDD